MFYSGVCFGEFLHVVPVFGGAAFSSFVTKFSPVMCVCLIFCGRRVTFFYVVFLVCFGLLAFLCYVSARCFVCLLPLLVV